MTQREIQNKRAKEKRKRQIELGLCRCGSKAKIGYKLCPQCLSKAREASREKYRLKVGIPLNKPVSKKGGLVKVKKKYKKPLTSIVKGVIRTVNKDGYGREDTWYVASAMVKGKSVQRKWSVSKYGESGAKLLATLQKMSWLIEFKVWNPNEGDPLALLGYTDIFNGNRDYDDCEVVDQPSPWMFEYEDVA